MSVAPDPAYIDEELRELDADVKRAVVTSQYRPFMSPDDPEIVAIAKDKVAEERFLATLSQDHVEMPRRRYHPLQAEGLAYLQRHFSDLLPHRHPNLGTITRFQRLLIERGANMRRKPTRGDRLRAADYGAMDPLQMVDAPGGLKMTAAAAEIILKMAMSAHVAPGTVQQILIYYGLEHLSRELREKGAAPPPTIPNRTAATTPAAPLPPPRKLIGL